MSLDAMEETSKGLGQFGINTEMEPTTRRLYRQGTMKPIEIFTRGRQPFPYHGKQYDGVPSNSGRVEATDEPRVYGIEEDARIAK
jgi:hypothetical protein